MRRTHTDGSTISHRAHLMLRIIGAIVFLLVFGTEAHAATIFFEPPTADFRVFDSVRVDVYVETEGETINAVEGTLIYPSDTLRLTGISDGDSVISLWVERPREVRPGEIRFSGIIPGGFSGVLQPDSPIVKGGKLLRLEFVTESTGDVIINGVDVHVLLNDGNGTRAFVTMLPFDGAVVSNVPHVIIPPSDEDAPEPFLVSLHSEQAVYDGKFFIIFSTTDKDSGVDHYEVCEEKNILISKWCVNGWTTATSPHLIADQALESTIKVKAIDRSGNEQIAVLPAEVQTIDWWLAGVVVFSICVFALILLIVARKRYFSRA